MLFDLEADPLEQHEVSRSNPTVVASLMAKLQAFNATNIPQENAGIDPRSSPSHFGNVWTPWEGDPDPSKCASPPLPPPPACVDGGVSKPCSGSVDSLVLNASTGCSISGWVAASGYGGPSMLVQLVVDKVAVGKPVIGSIHRTIAGDHGFKLDFPCELAAGPHRHTFEAVAKLNVSSTTTYVVGEKCSLSSRPVAC